jgi:hypothetical protein
MHTSHTDLSKLFFLTSSLWVRSCRLSAWDVVSARHLFSFCHVLGSALNAYYISILRSKQQASGTTSPRASQRYCRTVALYDLGKP